MVLPSRSLRLSGVLGTFCAMLALYGCRGPSIATRLVPTTVYSHHVGIVDSSLAGLSVVDVTFFTCEQCDPGVDAIEPEWDRGSVKLQNLRTGRFDGGGSLDSARVVVNVVPGEYRVVFSSGTREELSDTISFQRSRRYIFRICLGCYAYTE